jgi:hypothetical protein
MMRTPLCMSMTLKGRSASRGSARGDGSIARSMRRPQARKRDEPHGRQRAAIRTHRHEGANRRGVEKTRGRNMEGRWLSLPEGRERSLGRADRPGVDFETGERRRGDLWTIPREEACSSAKAQRSDPRGEGATASGRQAAGPGSVGVGREGQEGQDPALNERESAREDGPCREVNASARRVSESHEGRRRTPASRDIFSASPCIRACARESVRVEGAGEGRCPGHGSPRGDTPRGAHHRTATGTLESPLRINEPTLVT